MEEVSIKEFFQVEIKGMCDNITNRIDRVDNTLRDHNGRLKVAELWRERIVGMFISASVLFSVLAFILGGLVFPALVKAIFN